MFFSARLSYHSYVKYNTSEPHASPISASGEIDRRSVTDQVTVQLARLALAHAGLWRQSTQLKRLAGASSSPRFATFSSAALPALRPRR